MTRPKFLHNKCERLIKLLRIQVTVAVGGSTSYWIMCLVFHRTEWLYCIKRMFLSTPSYLFLWHNNKQTEGVCVRTWQVCHTLAVVTVQSYVDSDLRGEKKKNKMIRRRMKRITRSCWIAHRDRIHPCETHWQLVSMETTQHCDKARMLATEIKMIKRRLWIKHGGIKEEISR